MALKPKQLRNALASIIDKEAKKDLVTAGMIKDIQTNGNDIVIEIELHTENADTKEFLSEQVESELRKAAQQYQTSVGAVKVTFAAKEQKANEAITNASNPLPNVKHIIAVGAGKGGVGKSTISTTLAIGLARADYNVGLLDGDIYGPSMTTMLGLQQTAPRNEDNMLLPFEAHGIKAITMGNLVEPDRALIWRGPRAHSAFNQLATQTKWGELDYLIVDLPPGTGDVPLSLAQLLPLTGAIIVCTPQAVAQDDARRAIRMFEQLGVPILGLIENMSYFIGDDEKEYDIFGKGGGEQLATIMNIGFLGGIPLHQNMRIAADAGKPEANWDINDVVTNALDTFVKNVIDTVEAIPKSRPTLTID